MSKKNENNKRRNMAAMPPKMIAGTTLISILWATPNEDCRFTVWGSRLGADRAGSSAGAGGGCCSSGGVKDDPLFLMESPL